MYFFAWILPLLAVGAAPTDTSADVIASVLLGAESYTQASSQLSELPGHYPDPAWALEPLLSRVANGTDTKLHLSAVCHADRWADGAWWLEMQGAAYDAVSAAPERFVRRYLEGNDCALLMILYALKWPAGSLSVMYECEPGLAAAVDDYNSGMENMRERIWSALSIHDGDPRHRLAFVAVNAIVDAWPAARDRHLAWCQEQGE